MHLLIAIHCHQPADNFEHVYEACLKKSYFPFLKVLENYPDVKIALHYSGNLLNWLLEKNDEFKNLLKKLVDRGQIEFLTGGYFEPILTMIPEEDAIGQIKMLTEKIQQKFGKTPEGAWLTERVWEPKVINILHRAGVKYTIVDDTHFTLTGKSPETLQGYYITEDTQNAIMIFAGSKFLRYSIPFKPHNQTFEYLRRKEDEGVSSITFADDGEKFGFWPDTYEWVYKKGWLDKFFQLILKNKDWLKIQTFSEYITQFKPTQIVYLPCASYQEMQEWSGGYFKNFLIKYPESNWMHKRMLEVSQKLKICRQQSLDFTDINRLKANKERLKQAQNSLFMAQDNDAYWHGVFGGLYLTHLRSGVYSHLIEAEKTIDKMQNFNLPLTLELKDIDFDFYQELRINSPQFYIYIKPSLGGSIYELDYKPKNANLIATIAKRKESYHNKLVQSKSRRKNNSTQPVSIHNIASQKDNNLNQYLNYDLNQRACLLEHFLLPDCSFKEFSKNNYVRVENFANSIFQIYDYKEEKNTASIILSNVQSLTLGKKIIPVKLTKEIYVNIYPDRLRFKLRIENLSNEKFCSIFGTEFNFALSKDEYEAKLCIDKQTQFILQDVWYKIKTIWNMDKPCRIWQLPIFTVSDSEAGIEKTYQGLCTFLNWDIELKAKSWWEVEVEFRVESV